MMGHTAAFLQPWSMKTKINMQRMVEQKDRKNQVPDGTAEWLSTPGLLLCKQINPLWGSHWNQISFYLRQTHSLWIHQLLLFGHHYFLPLSQMQSSPYILRKLYRIAPLHQVQIYVPKSIYEPKYHYTTDSENCHEIFLHFAFLRFSWIWDKLLLLLSLAVYEVRLSSS